MIREDTLDTGSFRWTVSEPFLAATPGGSDPEVAHKDPSLVFHEGFWHLFTTVRFGSGKVDIAYRRFRDWSDAATAPSSILALHDRYYCAPQVFYHTRQRQWFLIFQLADPARTPSFQPCFSTNDRLDNPKGWSRPQPLMANPPEKPKWLDFWVIFDATHAHLFWTSLDGRIWRCQTERELFPGKAWSTPQVALQADLFEASHTYKLKGRPGFLTVVEAQGQGRRYYKAYRAETLAGGWKPLADRWERPFAGLTNCPSSWTTSISHGELVRSRNDETLEIDPAHLRFVFQGASDREYRRAYGQIPWRLGVLTAAPSSR